MWAITKRCTLVSRCARIKVYKLHIICVTFNYLKQYFIIFQRHVLFYCNTLTCQRASNENSAGRFWNIFVFVFLFLFQNSWALQAETVVLLACSCFKGDQLTHTYNEVHITAAGRCFQPLTGLVIGIFIGYSCWFVDLVCLFSCSSNNFCCQFISFVSECMRFASVCLCVCKSWRAPV